MKQFRFCIIDDRDNPDYSDYGWKILIAPLVNSNYLKVPSDTHFLCHQKTREFCFLDTDGKFQTPKGAEAIIITKTDDVRLIEDLIENAKSIEADVFLIDIDYTEMDDLDFEKKKHGGLALVNALAGSAGEKILYSASEHTEDLRRAIHHLGNYLQGLHLLEISGISRRAYRGKAGQESRKALVEIVDAYTRQKQIEIIDCQPIEFRQELKARITNSKCLDTPDISDDGTEQSRKDSEKCWSLRTLFPKQINNIEDGKTINEMKQHVISILNQDWGKLMSEGFLNHPIENPDKFGGRLKDAMITAQTLDFRVRHKARQYKKLTNSPVFSPGFDMKNKEGLGNLRDNLLKGTAENSQIIYLHNNSTNPPSQVQSLIEYFSALQLCDESGHPVENSGLQYWFTKWKSLCTTAGIYPMDIAYISHIAFHNARHLPEAKPPSFCLDESKNDWCHFTWVYDEMPIDITESVLGVHAKLELKSRPPDRYRILNDAGLSDIGKIACWRYNGQVEFRVGNFRVQAIRQNGRIRAHISDNLGELPRTQLKVSIPKLKT